MELVTLCTVIFQKTSVGAFFHVLLFFWTFTTKASAVFNNLFAGNRFLKFKPLLIEIDLVKVAYTAILKAIF